MIKKVDIDLCSIVNSLSFMFINTKGFEEKMWAYTTGSCELIDICNYSSSNKDFFKLGETTSLSLYDHNCPKIQHL